MQVEWWAWAASVAVVFAITAAAIVASLRVTAQTEDQAGEVDPPATPDRTDGAPMIAGRR